MPAGRRTMVIMMAPLRLMMVPALRCIAMMHIAFTNVVRIGRVSRRYHNRRWVDDHARWLEDDVRSRKHHPVPVATFVMMSG
jgi:hypothetical protein